MSQEYFLFWAYPPKISFFLLFAGLSTLFARQRLLGVVLLMLDMPSSSDLGVGNTFPIRNFWRLSVCLSVLASLSILNHQIVHQAIPLLLDVDFLLNLLEFLMTGPVVTENLFQICSEFSLLLSNRLKVDPGDL